MMFRRVAPFALAAALVAPTAAKAGSTTTRIETRPYYGATVTLEHGVRVFRPLPPHDRVIINPGGTTPLNLGIEEHRSISHNHYYDHGGRQTQTAPDAGPGYVYGGGYWPDRRGGHHLGRGAKPIPGGHGHGHSGQHSKH
jgi:hypothetical protein